MEGKRKLLLIVPVMVGAFIGAACLSANIGHLPNAFIAEDDDKVSRSITGSDTLYTDSDHTNPVADVSSYRAIGYFRNYYNDFSLYNVEGYNNNSLGIIYGNTGYESYIKNDTPIYGLTKITVIGSYKARITLSNESGDQLVTDAGMINGSGLVIDLSSYAVPANGPYRYFKIMSVAYSDTSGVTPVHYNEADITSITYEYSKSACKTATGA